jgi:hypothetical protein
VATPSEVLLHVPPGEASLRVMLKATQTEDGPVIIAGEALTVTTEVVRHVPIAYVITVVPADTPETTPPVPIVATAVLLLLHEPPNTASLSVIVVPSQTAWGPRIAVGADATVTTYVDVQLVPRR